MTGRELKEMYLDFFKGKGHAVISGRSLIPENDPTVLFTTAGMHPLVPYLLGEPHPAGRRLCDCQKCIRTGDIDDVGDAHHLTFFEMLGNWSLGDYFKDEAIAWSFEFLTSGQHLGFDPNRLFVTVFEGNEWAPRDEESARVWRKLGIPDSRIFSLPAGDNWWGPAGLTGPCGPDTEMFVDTGKQVCGPRCRPGCSCGKFFEIWNDVFMQYEKTRDGKYVSLKQHNVDTGMGVERTVAMMQGKSSVYETESFSAVIAAIEAGSGRGAWADESTTRAFRVIADHMRSSVFILGDELGVAPGNLGQGYVLRRLIRRAIRFAKAIGLGEGFTRPVAEAVIAGYRDEYPGLDANSARVFDELDQEEKRFEKTLSRGMAELEKALSRMKEHMRPAPSGVGSPPSLSGRVAFKLYDTYGFPLEFTEEICREHGLVVDRDGFHQAFDKHKEVSKQGSERVFKGGLADASQATTRLHTATHLLHKSLQAVLGAHVRQKGSNITADRLRFDFSHPQKMTEAEIARIESLVNDAISRDLPVAMEAMTLDEAKGSGAMALFSGKYGDQVKVYSIGDFSKEVCGGPHVQRTGELGRFRITKEEACGAGVRRVRAVLE